VSGPARSLQFGPFRLDPGELLKDGRRVPLQPRPLALLRYLAERPGRVVSGDELLAQVWGGVAVTRAVLKVAMRGVRQALGDEVAQPRFIETVGREGYRFLAVAASAARSPEPACQILPWVGRAAELARLRGALAASLSGARRIVLISGEAGIGKTSLLDRFLAELDPRFDLRVGRGQCLEGHGPSEPYLPVLEALGRLCRETGAEPLEQALRAHAPSWVAQLPGLGEGRGAAGASTPERMLRELADALAVATAQQPLVLALEDLHWCDSATLDLISCLARRRDPARLLIVGSYRPADAIASRHPIHGSVQELLGKGLCDELALELLGADDVAEYLGLRLGESADLAPLAAALHARTAGNALFLASAVDDLVAHGLVRREGERWRLAVGTAEAAGAIPAAVQHLIEQQADRLPALDQRLLEAASVAGVSFAVASLAAALETDPEELEDRCERLAAQRRFIEPAGLAEWPDGTLCGRYRFRHPLRSHVLYGRVAEARRVRLHRAIAAREEAGLGARAGEQAAELAAHFERGHEYERAVVYCELAGDTALARNAPREAAAQLERALDLLAELPASRARDERELGLRMALAAPRMALHGFAAAAVRENYERARALCVALGVERELWSVLRGLASHHQVRGELAVARALGEELLARVAQTGDVVAQVQANYGQGVTLFHAGDPSAAREYLERALALYGVEQHADHVRRFGGYDPGVACRLWLAWTVELLGRPSEGPRHAHRALALAAQLGHPLTLAFARYGVAITHQTLGEWDEALSFAEQSIVLSDAEGFAYELGLASILRGWALVLHGKVEDGVAVLRVGLERYAATGARLASAYRMLLAAGEAVAGRTCEAYALAREALALANGREELETVEVRCGAARVLLAYAATQSEPQRSGLAAEAVALLESSVALARAQRAPLLELIAATGLARLEAGLGRTDSARALLSGVVERFAGQPEFRDLRQAVRLLERLNGPRA